MRVNGVITCIYYRTCACEKIEGQLYQCLSCQHPGLTRVLLNYREEEVFTELLIEYVLLNNQ